MLCRGCGKIIPREMGDVDYHLPACWPDFRPLPGMHGMTPYHIGIREDMIEVALWADRNKARSRQIALGVSEVGQECERRLGYRMADIPIVRHSPDPWPAIVGTSLHTWWEGALAEYQAAHRISQWLTELELAPSPLVKGHSDLYDTDRKAVLDWKFPSPDNLKAMRENGPSAQYKIQVQLYGLGQRKAGREVERVGLIAIGRQGWLKDMYVWTTEYDEQAAEAALQRVYDLGAKLINLGVVEQPSQWEQVEASPSRLCSWCPWYDSAQLGGASDKGCPGL